MSLDTIIESLEQETLLLDANNLLPSGNILKILDDLHHPGIEEAKEQIQSYLEALIMKEVTGEAPEVSVVVAEINKLINIIKRGDVDVGKKKKTKSKPKKAENEEQPKEKTEESAPAEQAQSTETETAAVSSDPDEPDEKDLEDPDLLSDFIGEATEHLESIELNMVEWEKNPKDTEIVNTIFRPFHTIKGVAGFLNLQKVNMLAHNLENLLDEAREGRIKLSNDLSDLIFDGVDMLKAMLDTLEQYLQDSKPIKYSVNIDSFIQRLVMFLNVASAKSDDDEDWMGEEKPHVQVGEILVKEGKIKEDELKESLENQASSDVKQKIGEILVKEKTVSARDVRDAIRKQAEPTKRIEKYLKVDTTKMDQLLDIVGELVISQSMVTENPEVLKIPDQRLSRDLSQLQRVTKVLQNISMSMRLVPIGATFQKMNRIVRDLARKSGKEITLVLEGQNSEIDRNMVEELYDPLVHMVRNSCDHGIQDPDFRTKNGKPAEGTILLKAEHAGGKIVISISDDGEGLNRDKILAKAIEKGLVGEDEQLEDKDIFRLVFMPGFSTATKVTNVSGRGVGMDVVKKAIEKLRGTVDIISNKGVGTIFTIKLPLTTAIIDGMLVMVNDVRYIIPTLSVRRLVRPEKKAINTIVGQNETVLVRGHILPLVRMRQLLGSNGAEKEDEDIVLVIVEDNGKEVALQVDKLLGKQEVVIKTLGERFKDLKGVAGGAILGDGRIGLILDVRSIINVGEMGVNTF